MPPPTVKEALRTTLRALVPLAMPVIILGGIYTGKFTATEAAAIAGAYALLVFLIRSKFNLKAVYECLLDSAKISAGPLFMVATAGLFSYLMVFAKVPTTISEGILNSGMGPVAILLTMNVIFFIIGSPFTFLYGKKGRPRMRTALFSQSLRYQPTISISSAATTKTTAAILVPSASLASMALPLFLPK